MSDFEYDAMDADEEAMYPIEVTVNQPQASSNSHLKGRKRFIADLSVMREECKRGFTSSGLRMQDFRPGDDEGVIELLVVEEATSNLILNANLFVSDTSDYPKNHTCFGAAADGEITARLERVLESISSNAAQPLRNLASGLLLSIASAMDTGARKQPASLNDLSDDGSDEEYEGYDYDEDISTSTVASSNRHYFLRLQRDFVDIVASDYRPGFIQFGDDDFCVSVSLPVITLANSIPARALHAWDRRLLSRSQNLALSIYGFRGVYPVLAADGTYTADATRMGATLSFKVGLTKRYKPGKSQAREAMRTFGITPEDQQIMMNGGKQELPPSLEVYNVPANPEVREEETELEDEGRFDRFSLSSSLESLMDDKLLKLIQYRRKFRLGWAGAETLHMMVEQSQTAPIEIISRQSQILIGADREEAQLRRTYRLPHDPLYRLPESSEINLPLTAFCYLIRRLTLVSRYCIVCHNPTRFEFETLKPYVCGSKLCSYQYYAYNQGPSLEYEIVHNPVTVDLLVSLAYCSASEGSMDDPMPVGMGLRVPPPTSRGIPQYVQRGVIRGTTVVNEAQGPQNTIHIEEGGLCDFDSLTKSQMREAIVGLIDSLPSIDDMKKHLTRKAKPGQLKQKLRDLDSNVLPAAWSILRWCVASCTAHLEELTSANSIRGLSTKDWRQFHFSIGAPDAEAKFRKSIAEAQTRQSNARMFPTLYAFHGSPLRNWHSIIRHGLWYKEITYGRTYGNGVYLAKDGRVSMKTYASRGHSVWRNSKCRPTSCVALAEVVNVPSEFVSCNPHYVVKDTQWIMCRYLLVGTGSKMSAQRTSALTAGEQPTLSSSAPLVKHDPKCPVVVGTTEIQIPDPTFELESLLSARKNEQSDLSFDADDLAVFQYVEPPVPVQPPLPQDSVPTSRSQRSSAKPVEDWTPDPDYVRRAIENLMPPPLEASTNASAAVQRELRTMLKEQNAARKKPGGLKELGWFLPDVSEDGDEGGGGVGDNLFQWIVELHSFDDSLPIAKDMKSK
ncbi:hypothetical protein HGRIS_010950 [Hohenbuehelia grisea]|uniref:PARP catalytic domain-containing protein n=1 Tax=Hohenbuehelia grisea TaxID=104357 RepID=A0ABR3IYM0_9AGAR